MPDLAVMALRALTLTKEDIIDTMAVLVALRNGQDSVELSMKMVLFVTASLTVLTTLTTSVIVAFAVLVNLLKINSAPVSYALSALSRNVLTRLKAMV